MVVRGRAPVVEVIGAAVPAPLRVGRGWDKGRDRERDRAEENGRAQEEGVEREREREGRRQVVESRVHGGGREGARREELVMPVEYGGMF